MRHIRFSLSALLLALAFGCDMPTPARDASSGADVSTPDSAVPPADAGMDGGGPTCGTLAPTDLTTPAGAEGLAIGRNGSIYVSTAGGVARIEADGTITPNWLRITGAATVWGMVLDATNTHLYVGSPSLGQVVTVSGLDGTPTYEMLVAVTAPNGLTMGPDGFLYVSDFANDDVLRVDVTDGTSTSILATPIPSANGVAFTDTGTLLVDSYSSGNVFELTLNAVHRESGRTTAASGVGSPDGIAIDENGIMYVGDNAGRVLRLAADGSIDTVLMATGVPNAANLEWGAGPLNCHHLYVASGRGVSRIELTVGQRAVPWH